MALRYREGVAERSTTAGTGAYTLLGSPAGRLTLASAMSTGDTAYFLVVMPGGPGIEVVLGTFTSPDQLARTDVITSSNADAAVNWPSTGQRLIQMIREPSSVWPMAMFVPGAMQGGTDDQRTRVRVRTTHAVNFAADFAGTPAYCRVAVAADCTFDVNKVVGANTITLIGSLFFANGSQIGVLATASGTEKQLAALDAIELLGDTVADTGLRDLDVTFLGTRF